MKRTSNLKPYRIRIDVDVVAPDRQAAGDLAEILCGLLQGRWWVKEVLPDGIEERVWLNTDGGDR